MPEICSKNLDGSTTYFDSKTGRPTRKTIRVTGKFEGHIPDDCFRFLAPKIPASYLNGQSQQPEPRTPKISNRVNGPYTSVWSMLWVKLVAWFKSLFDGK